MSKVLVAKRKKRLSLSLKDTLSKSTVEQKKEVSVKSTNWNVFEMEHLLTDNREEKLGIFHKKKMKKSSLPSISTLLSSSNEDSGISSLHNSSIEKPQQPKIQKYVQNKDIFVSKVANSDFNTSKQFDESISSRNHKKSQDYSISDMFSDDLSQKDYHEQELSYVSSPHDSQISDAKKVGDLLSKKRESRKEKIEKNLGTNRPGLRPESYNRESNLLSKTPVSNKQQKEPLNVYGIVNPSESNKDFSAFFLKAEKNSSSTFVPLETQKPVIEIYDNNGEPCIVCEEGNQTLSNKNRIKDKSRGCTKPEELDLVNSPGEIIADVDSDKSETYSINIILSDCNLDHSVNSEECDDRSIRMMHKKAIWYMDEASESTGINHNSNENLQLTGLALNFTRNDSFIGSAEGNNASQNSFQLSDPLVKFLDTGSQVSGQSNISLTPYMAAFDSQDCKISFEENNLRHDENRNSSFGIPQSMYIRQKSPFFNRGKTDNESTSAFKLYRSIALENQQSRPEIHLPIFSNQNYPCNEFNDDNKENEWSIFDPQEQHTRNKNVGIEFPDPIAQKFALFDSINESTKPRHAFDRNSSFFNIELNDACSTYEREKEADKNVGIVQKTGSENRSISVDKFLCSSSVISDISDKKGMKRSPSKRFWSVSHQVQTFVKGWLDADDELDRKVCSRCVDRKKISMKRRRLDTDSEEREARININPNMLLSNYSCEYDKSYTNERFEPKYDLSD